MDKDPAMSLMVRRTEIGRGKRIAVTVAALLILAGLIGVVVSGFSGQHVPQNAAAMTTPVAAAPPKVAWRPWWLQSSASPPRLHPGPKSP